MKIAISSYGKDLSAQLDPRFGRCTFFLIVDSDDMSFEVFNNESGALGGGAGIQAAQLVASKGVNAVITGNCGPNAAQTLAAAGIELFIGQTGTAKEVVEMFKKGGLKGTNKPNVGSHFGMGSGAGFGRESGMGQGQGGGRGMGRGLRRSSPNTSDQIDTGNVSGQQHLKSLKEQIETLNKKMTEIIAKINKMEKR